MKRSLDGMRRAGQSESSATGTLGNAHTALTQDPKKGGRQIWQQDDERALASKIGSGWSDAAIDEVARSSGKSVVAVRSKARRLGFKRTGIRRPRWSLESVKALKRLWPDAPESRMVRELGRDIRSIREKASSMGIYESRCRGRITLSDAAKRLGVCRSTLKRLIADSRTSVVRSIGRVRMIDLDEAKNIVERWLAKGRSVENIAEASKRTGVNRFTLRRWVEKDLGVVPMSKGVPAELLPSDVDRIIASRKARP